ncbi:hypothetical protein [Micromonospora sp. NPDC005413]|uniref:hypothetical protein n=1 Tax=Micromonospora sp. NPDC005413 TaxID=3154563 RepID=UPI0033BC5AC4
MSGDLKRHAGFAELSALQQLSSKHFLTGAKRAGETGCVARPTPGHLSPVDTLAGGSSYVL